MGQFSSRNAFCWVGIFMIGLFGLGLQTVYALTKEKHFHILVIHSYDEDYTAYPDFNRMIKDAFEKEGIQADFKTFYLDCEQYVEEPEKQRMYDYLDTVAPWEPDLILVNEDQATYSTLASGHPLVHKIPIVFCGVNFPNWGLLKNFDNVTGCWDHPDYLETVNMIEDLMGKTRVRFFYDNTYLGREVTRELAQQLAKKDVNLYRLLNEYLMDPDSTRDEILQDVMIKKDGQNERPPDSTQYYFLNMRDNKGNRVLWAISGMVKYSAFVQTKYDFTTMRIGKMAAIPTFTVINESFNYNQGVLGGYITTLDIQVEEAVGYSARILKGEDIASLPIRKSAKKYVIDWKELEHWHISLDKVPDYCEIINMPFYVRQKTFIVLVTTFFSLLILFTVFYLVYLYTREARQKREARENLRKEKEFLSLALEGSNIFAWKYDRKRDAFLIDKEFFDQLSMKVRPYTLQEMVSLTHPEDGKRVLRQFQELVKGLTFKTIMECRCDFNGAGYVWYEFRYIRLGNTSGTGYTVIGLILNIQDYKERELALTEARDLAAKAELKQSFLANMSHEIRTPLNAIVGFANLLIETEEQSVEEKREFINIINQNCNLLLKLIGDILELSRIESGSINFTFEDCSLRTLLEDVYNTHSVMIPENLEFRKEFPDESFRLYTDKYRLTQVITNFINNAVKFTHQGYIAIGYRWEETSNRIVIYVEDSGKGIPAKEQKMIFERFYKRDEFVQGTGLGLSICQGIVEKLGGKIQLKSEEGKGSCFMIVFPLNS